ncbi:MAG: universal stress protein, partial [Desulfuromusa sp.]|nr:universal stress protein [Desulfuromusa sp.]
LHIVPEIHSSLRMYSGDDSHTEFEQKNLKEAQIEIKKYLSAFVKKELKDNPEALARFAEVEVCIGHPVVEILEAATRLKADMIVMGTHGKGALEHAFLGSVAEKVLHRTTRPVLVVPLPKW